MGEAKTWPFHQVIPFDRSALTEVYRIAAGAKAWAAKAALFAQVAANQPGANVSRANLLYPGSELM